MAAPRANALGERFLRSARRECLDHLLLLGERHLRRALGEYVAYFNQGRPHQGRDQRPPVEPAPRTPQGPVGRRDVLGGLLHDYYRDFA